jgi:hypothetical protein
MGEPKGEGSFVARYMITCPELTPHAPNCGVLSVPAPPTKGKDILYLVKLRIPQPVREYPTHRVILAFLCEPLEQGGSLQGILTD